MKRTITYISQSYLDLANEINQLIKSDKINEVFELIQENPLNFVSKALLCNLDEYKLDRDFDSQCKLFFEDHEFYVFKNYSCASLLSYEFDDTILLIKILKKINKLSQSQIMLKYISYINSQTLVEVKGTFINNFTDNNFASLLFNKLFVTQELFNCEFFFPFQSKKKIEELFFFSLIVMGKVDITDDLKIKSIYNFSDLPKIDYDDECMLSDISLMYKIIPNLNRLNDFSIRQTKNCINYIQEFPNDILKYNIINLFFNKFKLNDIEFLKQFIEYDIFKQFISQKPIFEYFINAKHYSLCENTKNMIKFYYSLEYTDKTEKCDNIFQPRFNDLRDEQPSNNNIFLYWQYKLYYKHDYDKEYDINMIHFHHNYNSIMFNKDCEYAEIYDSKCSNMSIYHHENIFYNFKFNILELLDFMRFRNTKKFIEEL